MKIFEIFPTRLESFSLAVKSLSLLMTMWIISSFDFVFVSNQSRVILGIRTEFGSCVWDWVWLAKIMILKIIFFTKFLSKFWTKIESWWKIEILLKNRNFAWFFKKIEILLNNGNLVKNQNLVKIRKFGQTSKFS